MKELDKYIQNELIKQNNELFFIILYGCGGVIFQKHFFQLLGSKNEVLLNKIINSKLIKTKKIGRNKVVILKYSVYCYYNLSNKTPKITSTRLLHSALLCEMLISKYQDIKQMASSLLKSNYLYYFPQGNLNVLTRLHTLSQGQDTTALDFALAEHTEKLNFIKSSTKGRTQTLSIKPYKTNDLFTLKSNDIYIDNIKSLNNIIEVKVSIFATDKTAEKIICAISKAETTIAETLDGINIKIFYDIYSLDERLEKSENKVFSGLLKIKGNELKEELYNQTINFYWFNCKNRLFSGIDINKWL